MVTAFLFDDATFAHRPLPWFPCLDRRAEVRWRRASRPHAAVACARSHFADLIAQAGLEEERFVAGFHPGGRTPPAGQDTLVLKRAG